MPDLAEVTRVQKNSSTEVVFSLTEYNGEQYVDVREFVNSEAYKGFTRRGIRFHNRLVDEFINSLSQVKQALEKGGAEGEGEGEAEAEAEEESA